MITRRLCIIGTLAGMLLFGARQSYAIWVEEQVTPTRTDFSQVSFSIKSEMGREMMKFVITVTRKKGGTMFKGRLAGVSIDSGDGEIAYVPVQEKVAGDQVVFEFWASAKQLAKSKFKFSLHPYAETKNGQGIKEISLLPGGFGYWFYLQDFAKVVQR